MGEVHLTIKNGGVRILVLVEVQHVGMYQIYTVVLWLGLAGWAFLASLSLLGVCGGTDVIRQYTGREAEGCAEDQQEESLT